MNSLLTNIFAGLLRHALTYGGGALVSAGLIDASQSQQLVGALVTIAGVVWSAYSKWKTDKAVKAAATANVVDLAVAQAKRQAAAVEVRQLPPIQ
jgi:hypothetical protein